MENDNEKKPNVYDAQMDMLLLRRAYVEALPLTKSDEEIVREALLRVHWACYSRLAELMGFFTGEAISRICMHFVHIHKNYGMEDNIAPNNENIVALAESIITKYHWPDYQRHM